MYKIYFRDPDVFPPLFVAPDGSVLNPDLTVAIRAVPGNRVKKSDVPPVPFAIQRADINLTVAGGTASGTVQLEGEVFATGAVKVPLIAGMTLFDAIEARPVPTELVALTVKV